MTTANHHWIAYEHIKHLSGGRQVRQMCLRPCACWVCLQIGKGLPFMFDEPLVHQGLV